MYTTPAFHNLAFTAFWKWALHKYSKMSAATFSMGLLCRRAVKKQKIEPLNEISLSFSRVPAWILILPAIRALTCPVAFWSRTSSWSRKTSQVYMIRARRNIPQCSTSVSCGDVNKVGSAALITIVHNNDEEEIQSTCVQYINRTIHLCMLPRRD